MLKNLGNSSKIGLLTVVISLIGFIATFFLFFFNLQDVPLGILLGGLIFGGLSLLAGIMEKKDEIEHSYKFTLIFIIARFAVAIGLIVGVACLYFLVDYKIFNFYAVIGVYTLHTIITMIVYFISKK